MEKVIKDIIDRECSIEDKERALNNLSKDIEIAKKIINGGYGYCSECDDYYLMRTFFTEKENVVTEADISHSKFECLGGQDRAIHSEILYRVCPKGHKEIVYQNNLMKVKE